jgi:arginyl-tRNA--protein-N-Asp/Glu arginylyltransferase
MIVYHFAALADNLTPADLDEALSNGWFRMRQAIFTTTHLNTEDCYRVHWLRYPMADIQAHRSHEKIRKRNGLLRVEIESVADIKAEHEQLYSRYRASINFGAESIHEALYGDSPVGDSAYATHTISIYNGNKLIAGGYFDTGKFSAASILHFYDPEYKRNSLGKYLMLVTIDFLKARGFKFYYPGYVIAGKSKMDYKLFIGREAAQYFEPATAAWRSFEASILLPEKLSEHERNKVIIALS